VAKTSGSKGLQLYAPLAGTVGWDRSRTMARVLARELEQNHPDLVVSNMRKELRKGRVLVDWSQNHPMKTTVAAYSLRARDRPTASTPVSWDEVEACADSGDPADLAFAAPEVLDRLAERGDLFDA
jgi:bifunctional non-homologous end joining protein LigD